MKPKTSPHPDGGVFSIAVSRPPLPTSDKGYRSGEESPLRNTDMPYIVMVIQSVIIFITLSAFILYVFSPRSIPHLSPTVAPSFTVTFENSALFPPPPPSQPALPVVDETKQSPPVHHSHTMLGKFRKAAVVSDHGICSEIGRSILTKGGNAVDAAIATLICVGATNPQSSGIGGGFFMQVYQKDSGICTTINARETAPQNIDVKEYERTPDASSYGWKAIGVPGEVKGFWRAFTDYGSGKVAWRDLLAPTIKLCREGIPVSEYLAMILVNETKSVNKSNELREMFTNPATSKFYREGETMKREKLARTLERLSEAEDPAALFYAGDMADTIPLVRPAITSAITDSITQCGPPPPSSWIVTQLIVRIMAELYPEPRRLEDLDSVLFYHRLIEAEKFAYARRTRLGDPQKYYNPGMEDTVKELTNPAAAKMYAARIRDEGPQANAAYEVKGYVKEDHGTSHVSVIDEQGNAVAVTSSINLWLGAKVASSLGIIWNNQMDDFGVPGVVNGFGFLPSKENYIAPGKAPLSSMSPTIIYDRDGQVRVVIGTTGGSKIIQGVASVVVRSLLFNQTIKEAIDAPQIWNQMQPDHVQYEKDFPEHIVSGLRAMGHKLQEEVNMRSTTHALFVDEATKYIYANSDKRSPVHMHPDGY
ncbi:hypothetical protein PRIPAC_72506 [Pristionchus pacificus]|uniref:Uncharacterized protein n=1 Tax=Pristionchus pacificus TaxID=54126 RepID=A0A2A6C0L4_PRIPA|nr:hypothetical protein PRIPAC_72506 [Pristionchus pacificus]|eukprot:PDM71646.1 hypothetical protein PRIPAC_38053 [Pristionchus pacificus]